MDKLQQQLLLRIILATILLIAAHYLPLTGAMHLVWYLIIYLVIGYDILGKAIQELLHWQLFDENLLMAAATMGAFVLTIKTHSGDYNEAIAVLLLYQIGELFQDCAVEKSRRNIHAIMDLRPDYAHLEQAGQLVTVDLDRVEIGSIIMVQPGEKIPLDGVIVQGESNLNTAALTGESLPRHVACGDEVLSGCINLTGALHLQTTKRFGESTAAKILALVEHASARKARTEALITKLAKIYTPVVCGVALVLALLPPLVGAALLDFTPAWSTWCYRALTFLVISCPCALVISIPLTFFAGLGGASRAGILVKGANYLEALAQLKMLAFDKTGTLTHGVFTVNAIHHTPMEHAKLIEYAVLVESASSHPISKSLLRAYGHPVDRTRVSAIQEYSGNGVIAQVDGQMVAVGNAKLMQQLQVAYIDCHSVGTIVHIAIDRQYMGHLVIADQLKPSSQPAIAALKQIGIERIIMLTGDQQSVATQVGARLQVDEIYAELLPDGKVAKVEELMQWLRACSTKATLGFVGDGINDAPVLARADVGIAMGALGSDAALAAADVVLVDDDPTKIITAIQIARRCLRIVYQNIGFALTVKVACLVLGAVGLVGMWWAIFADVGVMVIAILNAMRTLYSGQQAATGIAMGRRDRPVVTK